MERGVPTAEVVILLEQVVPMVPMAVPDQVLEVNRLVVRRRREVVERPDSAAEQQRFLGVQSEVVWLRVVPEVVWLPVVLEVVWLPTVPMALVVEPRYFLEENLQVGPMED